MAGKIKADTIQGETSLKLNVGETTIITVDSANYNIAQPLNVQSTLISTGAANLRSTLTVGGAATLSSDATVTGNLTVTGITTLTSGTTTLASPTLTNPLITTIRETITISATAATGTINYDASTQSVLYYTSNASGNFTVNFRGTSSVSLNTLMSTGQSLSVTFLVTNGSTAYYNSVVQVDGSTVTPKWQGGSAPTSGNTSSVDSYTYVIIKTGSATFTVLASQTKFA